jgi:hypothetical protein
LGAGRSVSSTPLGRAADGIGGGSFAAGGAGGGGVIAMRDLHSSQVMNFAPAGTLASDTRLSAPQAEQVASIMLLDHSSYGS